MKCATIVLFGLLAVGGVLAEEFTLVDRETGEQFGPFSYSNGVAVAIDGRVLQIERSKTRATEIEDRMRSIIIPTIEFREANVVDVLHFLSETSIAGMEQPGVNIVSTGLCLDKQSRPATNAISTEPLSGNPAAAQQPFDDIPKVSLNLRRVSLYDALGIVCEVVGLRFRVDDRGVVFVTPEGREIRSGETRTQSKGL